MKETGKIVRMRMRKRKFSVTSGEEVGEEKKRQEKRRKKRKEEV